MAPIQFIPADLAPGDVKSSGFDPATVGVSRVRSAEDPKFSIGYQHLWDEFGAAGEVEQKDVLQRRLKWDPGRPINGYSLLYEMIVVESAGNFVAVRDQTAIVARGADRPAAVVHLSHNLVAPDWRRSGIAGWLRAMPIQTARACLAASGLPENLPITLAGEMEPLSPEHPERMIRLKAYEKAGFLKIDPSVVPYVQPDFRSFDEIDASGGPRPIPMGLVVRRVGKESELSISGREVRRIVGSLYGMYGVEFREKDMRPVIETLRRYPADDAVIRLVPPASP